MKKSARRYSIFFSLLSFLSLSFLSPPFLSLSIPFLSTSFLLPFPSSLFPFPSHSFSLPFLSSFLFLPPFLLPLLSHSLSPSLSLCFPVFLSLPSLLCPSASVSIAMQLHHATTDPTVTEIHATKSL